MRELFRRMHPNARSRNGLLSRIGSALARPWQTSYVCPSLMTATAVLYALRGYEPYWTQVEKPSDGGRNPSDVAYRIYLPTEDGRYPSHGVGLSCPPRWAVAAEHWARVKTMHLYCKFRMALRNGRPTRLGERDV